MSSELTKKINENYKLLSEWELKFDLSDNPNEKMRSEKDIQKIKIQIENYKTELKFFY